MPKGPARPWRSLAPHTRDAMPFVQAAIDGGHHDVEITMSGLTSTEEAELFRKGCHNAATLLGVSLHTDCVKGDNGYQFTKAEDGTYSFKYAVHKKSAGRKHVLTKHGPDRSQWAYNPRSKAPRDENGQRTDIP